MDLNPKHCKSFWNKKIILFVSLMVILAIGAGVTAAWLTGNTPPQKITLAATYAENTVDSFGWFSTDMFNVRVQNTGDVPGYIRMRQIFLWVKRGTDYEVLDTKEVLGVNVTKGEDYNTVNDWLADQEINGSGAFEINNWIWNNTADGDGYYYYTQPVEPTKYTSYVVGQTSQHKPGYGAYANTYPLRDPPAEGYRLEWTMVTDIIQADPDTSWQEAWAKVAATDSDLELEGEEFQQKKAEWEIPPQSRPTKAE